MAFTASKPELLTTPKIQAQGQVGRTFVFRIVNFLRTPTFLHKATGSIVLKHRPHTHTHTCIYIHIRWPTSVCQGALKHSFMNFYYFLSLPPFALDHPNTSIPVASDPDCHVVYIVFWGIWHLLLEVSLWSWVTVDQRLRLSGLHTM